ncbi:hypothetical protein [Paenibacillus elgii]|uniref:hypothetical protein n=1 Tax=Paenibacillus elgii TaxID=189691 RepID=UPI000248E091|nr:hypothetical protein [Paenibacillus elgii]
MAKYEVVAECVRSTGERLFPGDLIELNQEQYEQARKAGIVTGKSSKGAGKVKDTGETAHVEAETDDPAAD